MLRRLVLPALLVMLAAAPGVIAGETRDKTTCVADICYVDEGEGSADCNTAPTATSEAS
jgi:hypothetical protein